MVDVVDDTFCRAPRPDVREQTGASWAGWLPDLHLVVDEDRGDKGVRWSARTRGGAGGGLAGTAEVWLEEVAGGTVAHLYVRLDPVAGDPGPADVGGVGRVRARARRARRLPDRLRRTWKRGLHAWKDSLERGTTT